MKALLLAALVACTIVACTGSDDTSIPLDAGSDGAPACVLPTAPITCTGDPQCQAECGTAYCYNFNQVGMRCTMACSVGGNECPAGWTCNNMGRCRPPT